MDLAKYMTVSELAERWGVSRQLVDRWVQNGRIKSELFFGRRLIPRNTRRPKSLKPGPKAV